MEELQANLADYREQLQQVETLLLSDHTNEELKEMYDNLTEVIQLTEDLLAEAGIEAAAAPAAQPAAAAAPDPLLAAAAAAAAAETGYPSSSSHDAAAPQQQQQLVTPAQLNLPAMLPASVADQIRRAQVKQALLGQGNPAWAVGSECLALYSGDGQYYKATVKSVTDEGKFVVLYEGYGTEEEVSTQEPAGLLCASGNAAAVAALWQHLQSCSGRSQAQHMPFVIIPHMPHTAAIPCCKHALAQS